MSKMLSNKRYKDYCIAKDSIKIVVAFFFNLISNIYLKIK